jgi:LacI family transcriptional regulator
LAITPIDDQAVAEKLNELIEGRTEIVTFNTDIRSVDRLAYVGCNYQQSGNTAAGLLGMITGGQARIGIVTGSLKILGHHQRIAGFKETVVSDFPGLSIDAVVENNDNDELSYQQVKQMLLTYPEITALYFSAAGIEGGIKAVQEIGSERPLKIITVDLIPAVQQWLQSGMVAATICQEPYRQGYETIKLIFNRLVTGDKLESTIFHTENKIILKYNMV